MKKIYYIALVFSFLLVSCGGSPETTEEKSDEAATTEQTAEEPEESTDETIASCDDFLDNFEAWASDYVDVVEAYMKDPTSIETRQKYGEISEKAATWSQEWGTHIVCAQTEKYQKRYDEITEKLDKRLEELGMDN
ncbi:MAG: hypothetical protein ABFS05_08285 [Bacteroidota bacterium]